MFVFDSPFSPYKHNEKRLPSVSENENKWTVLTVNPLKSAGLGQSNLLRPVLFWGGGGVGRYKINSVLLKSILFGEVTGTAVFVCQPKQIFSPFPSNSPKAKFRHPLPPPRKKPELVENRLHPSPQLVLFPEQGLLHETEVDVGACVCSLMTGLVAVLTSVYA